MAQGIPARGQRIKRNFRVREIIYLKREVCQEKSAKPSSGGRSPATGGVLEPAVLHGGGDRQQRTEDGADADAARSLPEEEEVII